MTVEHPTNSFIRNHIENIKKKFSPLWWPKYLFHFSDINNIVSILENGILFSRNEAEKQGALRIDSAGTSVMENTPKWVLDYARLYFRPRTPPLFHIEGFCPDNNRESKYNAHCPLPIYLLFDSEKVLSLTDVKYSDGNLASSTSTIFDNIQSLTALDYGDIYHDYGLPNDPFLKDKIIKHRCAEVVIPKQLELDGFLMHIICRSMAERETLLNLLDSNTRKKYENLIYADSKCFFNNNLFVKKVAMQKNKINIEYSPYANLESFIYKYVFLHPKGMIVKDFTKPINIFNWARAPDEYNLEIEIDRHIAYKGSFIHLEKPF